MKTRNNIAILLAGSLAVAAPLLAQNGVDDGTGTSGTSGSSAIMT